MNELCIGFNTEREMVIFEKFIEEFFDNSTIEVTRKEETLDETYY